MVSFMFPICRAADKISACQKVYESAKNTWEQRSESEKTAIFFHLWENQKNVFIHRKFVLWLQYDIHWLERDMKKIRNMFRGNICVYTKKQTHTDKKKTK